MGCKAIAANAVVPTVNLTRERSCSVQALLFWCKVLTCLISGLQGALAETNLILYILPVHVLT